MIITTSKSIKNCKPFNKPNEDYYITDIKNNFFILTDGVSRDKENGVYPLNSPSRKVSEVFSNYAHHFLCENALQYSDKEMLLFNAMKYGNQKISLLNENYNGDFLPGTVGIIAIIINNSFYYAYIGDCFGVKISRTNKECFTFPQTSLIHKHIKEFSAAEIRNHICNNINHPYSYGVLNGSEEAENFIVTGSFDLKGVKCILLFSDGFENYINSKETDELLSMDVLKLKTESDYLSDDDKTIIKILVKG